MADSSEDRIAALANEILDLFFRHADVVGMEELSAALTVACVLARTGGLTRDELLRQFKEALEEHEWPGEEEPPRPTPQGIVDARTPEMKERTLAFLRAAGEGRRLDFDDLTALLVAAVALARSLRNEKGAVSALLSAIWDDAAGTKVTLS